MHQVITDAHLQEMWDGEDDPGWEYMWGDDMKEWTERAVRTGVLKNVQHGDTIRWRHNMHYRNEGLMFWSDDGRIVFPCTDYDDYGSVPPCFRVGEHGFRPDHWLKHVDHNCIVFLSDALVDQLNNAPTSSSRLELQLPIYGVTYTVKVHHNEPTIHERFDYTGHMTLEQI